MVITPNTVFKILSGVPFNATYSDTIWFRTQAEQLAYMQGKAISSFTDFAYVRQTGVVKVPVMADSLYGANYCMYQNTAYGNKWFYAFITSVDYVNDGMSEISFQIDLIQTWLFDFHIGKCFVEREHVSDDTIGKHTLPENLPFGDLVVGSEREYPMTPLIVASVLNPIFKGTLRGNIYTPLSTYWSGDVSLINGLLDDYADQPEKVGMLKMGVEEYNGYLNISVPSKFQFAGDSYTPVNKKLFTYPYVCFTVDDFGENVSDYKFEDFSQPDNIQLRAFSNSDPYPYLAVIPLNYKNMGAAYSYMMIKNDFPDCPYTIDNFRAWQSSVGMKQQIGYNATVAQQTLSNFTDAVSMAGSNVSSVVAGAQGNAPSLSGNWLAAIGGVRLGMQPKKKSQQISNEATEASMAVDTHYAATHGSSIGGSVGGGSVPWMLGKIGLRTQVHTIKPEYARIIDDYFTRFGYKVEQYKVPNLFTRTTFNYVKTVDANITGDAPEEALSGISRIFDGGITLWHTTSVGSYSLANDMIEGNK